jgi:predicted transcriptional regulator
MERAMAKEAVFTMKLEPELRDAFMAAAAAADRPASQIVREFMRDYVEQDREYVEFLRRKVERSRASIAAGKWSTQEQVEARAATRRAELQRRIDEANS